MPLKTRGQAAREAKSTKEAVSDSRDASESPPASKVAGATPPPESSDTDTAVSPAKHGGRPAGAATWKPWEDRTLALEVQAVRPWAASAQAAFQRNSSACKDRFAKLLKLHRKGELRAKQTTGEGGEIDEFIQIMTDIDTQLQDHEATKAAATELSKAKQKLEHNAGLAMRAAATQGLVRREELDDITKVAGASAREKAGQRKRPQLSRSQSSMENQGPQPSTKQRKRTNYRKEMNSMIAARQEADDKVLEEARQLQKNQHQEVTGAIGDMSHAIQNLVDVMAEDRKAQRAEQALLLSVIEKMAK